MTSRTNIPESLRAIETMLNETESRQIVTERPWYTSHKLTCTNQKTATIICDDTGFDMTIHAESQAMVTLADYTRLKQPAARTS